MRVPHQAGRIIIGSHHYNVARASDSPEPVLRRDKLQLSTGSVEYQDMRPTLVERLLPCERCRMSIVRVGSLAVWLASASAILHGQIVHPLAQPRYDQGPAEATFRLGHIQMMFQQTAAQRAG